jgi:DUF177 domain-containing protein
MPGPAITRVSVMKIEIHHIPAQGLSLNAERPARHFAGLKELIDSSECVFVAPLSIQLEVRPERDFIRIKGRIDTTIRQACVRCLDKFERPLKTRFTLNYSKKIPQDVHQDDAEAVELTAAQIGMIFIKGEEIDLTDDLQEQVIMAIPYKPLCAEDCRGLCAHCGHDLNTGPCHCGEQRTEGPFAMLKNLNLPVKK